MFAVSLLLAGTSCNLLSADLTHHNHGDGGDHLEHVHDNEERQGRSSGLLIDFSTAVDDPESGLKRLAV